MSESATPGEPYQPVPRHKLAFEISEIGPDGQKLPPYESLNFPGLTYEIATVLERHVAAYLALHPYADPKRVREVAMRAIQVATLTDNFAAAAMGFLPPDALKPMETREAKEVLVFHTDVKSFDPASAKELRKRLGMTAQDTLIGVAEKAVLERYGMQHGDVVLLTLDGKTPQQLTDNDGVPLTGDLRVVGHTPSVTLQNLTLPPTIRKLRPDKLQDHRENGNQGKLERGEIEKKDDKGNPTDYSVIELAGPDGKPLTGKDGKPIKAIRIYVD